MNDEFDSMLVLYEQKSKEEPVETEFDWSNDDTRAGLVQSQTAVRVNDAREAAVADAIGENRSCKHSVENVHVDGRIRRMTTRYLKRNFNEFRVFSSDAESMICIESTRD